MANVELSAELLNGKTVLFKSNGPLFIDARETLRNGTVLSADDRRHLATICYLSGASTYTDDVPYDKLVAIADAGAPSVEIENYSGRFIDLR